jgi:tyrosyl-tRNA synthetase
MFGKLMSIPDDLMWSYYELVTDRTPQQIAALKKEVLSGTLHPMDAKMRLAEEVISDFHGKEAARKAAENFQRVFRERLVPEEMRHFRIVRATATTFFLYERQGDIEEAKPPFAVAGGGSEKWSKILVLLEQVPSVSEAERLIKQGALEINGVAIKDPSTKLTFSLQRTFTVRVGKKKFLRIVVEC